MDWVTFVSVTFTVLGIYTGLGLVIALFLAFFAIGKLDPAAKDGTWGFRLLIIPGLVALWPLMLMRLVRGINTPPVEHNAHRNRAGGKA